MQTKELVKTPEEAVAWIHSRLKFGARPGLIRVKALLSRLKNPEKGQHFIHIAGTNGKGSSVKFLANLLEEIGLTVGTFTSPYIVSFNERIQINGKFISEEDLLTYVQYLQPIVWEMDEEEALAGITEFEINTALALLYFKDRVDVAIMEVGLGGLYDSTNVITPIVSGISTIGYDHMDILGDTLEKIAFQKAGIIKPEVPVVTGNISQEALDIIQQQAEKKQSTLYAYEKDYQVVFKKDLALGERFSYSFLNQHLEKLDIPLMGRHQVENAAFALTLFFLYCQRMHYQWQEKEIRQGLLNTKWPARMEVLCQQPLILLDGAHNDHAVKRLVENIKTRFKDREVWLLYSSLKTKDISEMLKDFKKIPHSHLVVTTFDYPKTLNLEDLQVLKTKGYKVAPSFEVAIEEIIQNMDESDVFIITGSLYFSSQVRPLFQKGGKFYDSQRLNF